jgi:hypothetical protein
LNQPRKSHLLVHCIGLWFAHASRLSIGA